MNPSRLLGTLFGSGLSPVMPGTCGSIVAVLMVCFVPGIWYGWVTGVLAVVAIAVGPRLADDMIARTGRHDPQTFVLDEAAGVWIAAFRPEHPGWLTVALALVCFRVLDILKPWPIRRVERLPGGYGVVYDDVLAGVLALAATIAFDALRR